MRRMRSKDNTAYSPPLSIGCQIPALENSPQTIPHPAPTMTEKPLAIDYFPLVSETDIRILTLGQGSGDDTIQCILFHGSREGDIYQALSYEWGEESDDDPFIIVNGELVQVRSNLYSALKHIRDPSHDLALWIDAICINQGDLEEKSEQVARMGETFANAPTVIAWLGEAKDGSETAMDLMSSRENLMQNVDLRPGLHPDSPERKALIALCHRTYWRRVWIIQELFLAQQFIVRCGTKAITRDKWEPSVAGLNSLGWEEMADNPADEHRQARYFSPASGNKLFRWLSMCIKGDFQFSNPYDLVYALVGISDDCKNGRVVINYEKPLREVYLEGLQINAGRWGGHEDVRWEVARRMGLEVDERLRREMEEALRRG
ncbi:hypothetical protein ACJ41O_013169 [Fusarium nematophilum]